MKTKKYRQQIIYYIFIIMLIFSLYIVFIFNNNRTITSNLENEKNIKSSALIGEISLTNTEINNTQYYQNSVLTLEGRAHQPGIPSNGLSGYIVAIEIDGVIYGDDDTTDPSGDFQITHTLSNSLNVYANHTVKAQVTTDLGIHEIFCKDFFIIDVNSTSILNVIKEEDTSYLPQEQLIDLSGNLIFSNGTGIPNSEIRYQWYNDTYPWGIVSRNTGPNGEIPDDITVPPDIYSGTYSLYIYFPRIDGVADSDSINITNIEIFIDLLCIWNTQIDVSEGEEVQLSGQIVDINDTSRKFKQRDLEIYDQTSFIGNTTTDSTGNFSFPYQVPGGIGPRTLNIILIEDSSVYSIANTSLVLNVSAAITPAPFGIPLTPLQWFFIIGGPIIIGIIAVVSIYGYKRFNKKLVAAQTIKIPLEDKIRNLKILKDSDRIEEALSYLFNAIYIEMVSAKYGRIKKPNETIRDFAIISVREFKLDPTKIYPFIQKVEEIIYARPYQVADKEFYETVGLFSPIYYQLTGHNFILSF